MPEMATQFLLFIECQETAPSCADCHAGAQLKAQRKQQKLQAKMAKKGKGALPASAYAHKWVR
jgi:hypothetical protein